MITTETVNPCHCIIHHPLPGPEREAVVQDLMDARGETITTILAMHQLSTVCPAQVEAGLID